MLAEGKTGPSSLADSTTNELRLDKQGAGVVTDAHGRYHEATYRGNVFMMDSDSVTLAAANASKTALATVKFINGFYNPSGSNRLASILWSSVATTSGTPAGAYFYNFISGVVATNAATGTIRNAYLVGQQASGMIAETGVVLTVSGGATTALTQLCIQGGPAAIAAGAGLYASVDEVAGRIIVPPGCLFGITALGAGTSHVVQSTLVWEELPV